MGRRTRRLTVLVVAALAAAALVAPTAASAHRGHDDRGKGHHHSSERGRHRDRDDRDRGRDDHDRHRGDRDRCNAGRGEGPVRVVAEGLNMPFGLDIDGRTLYVAESAAGQVTQVDLCRGRTRVAVDGLPGAASVAALDDRLAVITGQTEPPPDVEEPGEEPGEEPNGGEPNGEEPNGDADPTFVAAVEAEPPAPDGGSSVFLVRSHRGPKLLADLLAHELEHNPDGQLQFDPTTNAPLDALSNPFDVMEYRNGSLLVADAGANAVLKVSRRGHVSTFFVPPVVTTGACEGLENNDPEHAGCDPVPTGLAWGPRGTIYVSTLSAEVPGEGRVYVLDGHSGKVRKVISGFNGPTGVAVSPDGTLYVSEVLHNAPPMDGPPPAGFDPARVGRIVKVSRHGDRTYAAVTMPTGLEFHDGKLYASAWSIAPFFGMMDAGQVVQVGKRAFVEEAAPLPPL